MQEQKGGHYPTFDLVLSTQRSDVGYDNQTSPQRDTEYIGVDINLPLFAGGSTSARVREAWSQYYIAREEEEGGKAGSAEAYPGGLVEHPTPVASASMRRH